MFEHRNYKIDITQNGKFVTTVGEVEITTHSLDECYQAIDKEIAGLDKPEISLAVFGVLYKKDRDGGLERTATCASARVVGFNRTTRDPQFSGLLKGEELRNLVPDTPGNRVLLIEWLQKVVAQESAKKDVDKVAVHFSLGYGRLDIDGYGEKLEAAKQQYEKALKASK